MTGRLVKLSVFAVAFLVTTSSVFASYNCCWKCYLEGVDKYGCCTSTGGCRAISYTCINTTSGYFTSKCNGYCVKNCTGCYQTYCNKNLYCEPAWWICVTSSIYCVGKQGGCTYTCCGYCY